MALFSSAERVEQKGTLWRIASGCKEGEMVQLKELHKKLPSVSLPTPPTHQRRFIQPLSRRLHRSPSLSSPPSPSQRFRIHFSPETEVRDKSGHRYKYANKPRGMQHWLAAVSSQGRYRQGNRSFPFR